MSSSKLVILFYLILNLDKTLQPHVASFHDPRVKCHDRVTANCQGSLMKYWGGEPCHGLASHPGGSSVTPSCFMLRKPG